MTTKQKEVLATVSFNVEDVLTIRPNMTHKQAEQALITIRKNLEDNMIEMGWDVMDNLLDCAGHKRM